MPISKSSNLDNYSGSQKTRVYNSRKKSLTDEINGLQKDIKSGFAKKTGQETDYKIGIQSAKKRLSKLEKQFKGSIKKTKVSNKGK